MSNRSTWCVYVKDDGESVGALALGASLRKFKSGYGVVAIVSPEVRRRAVRDLELSGFRVIVSKEKSLAKVGALLSEYEVIGMLEVASLAMENIDRLLKCPGRVCAVFKGSREKADSSPIVFKPLKFSEKYLKRLAYCEFWDPLSFPEEGGRHCYRLPERYAASALFLVLNANPPDAPLQLVRTANLADPAWSERRRAALVHLKLGSGRPWHWFWALTIMPLAQEWQQNRDDALHFITQSPRYHELEYLQDRASENFSLARAIALPWLFALLFYYLKKKGDTNTSQTKRKSISWILLLVLSKHLTLLLLLFIAFRAAQGFQAFHTFFRPSVQLLRKRSPYAAAAVFYSTLSAGFFAISASLKSTLLFALLILLPILSSAYTTSLLSTLVPLLMVFLLLPIITTLTFLSSYHRHPLLSSSSSYSERRSRRRRSSDDYSSPTTPLVTSS